MSDNEGWAAFGKGCAWILGIAAAGAAVVGIGYGVYTSGEDNAKRTAEEASRKEIAEKIGPYENSIRDLNHRLEDQKVEADNAQKSKLEDLAKKGLLLPEDSCFRYERDEHKEAFHTDGCDAPIYVSFERLANLVQTGSLTFGKWRADLYQGNYNKPKVYEHVNEVWNEADGRK